MRRVTLLLWTLTIAAGLTACQSSSQAPDGGTPLTEAVPPDELRGCRMDDDCTKVNTSCNGCCEQAAVNAASTAAYDAHKVRVCAGYAGPICNCFFRPSRVLCREHKCTLEPTDGG